MTNTPLALDRRTLLAASAGILVPAAAHSQRRGNPPTVFSNISIITPDRTWDDAGLAVVGDRIAAIGPAAEIARRYPNAQVYDGRGKAVLPGLVNCHAHLAATLERGFNEDFGFPNSARLAVRPGSLLSPEERTLMVAIGALEAIRSGTTTLVENVGGIASSAAMLASTGLRMVFAESVNDTDNVAGAVSPERAAGPPPIFSAAKRDAGIARITDLHGRWHGKADGRVSVFPAAALAETSSPALLRWVRDFAEKHDLGYTIHLSQSKQEVDFMRRSHGVSPVAFLARAGFLGPRLFAAHCRYVDDADIALLGGSKTIVSHQAVMAANRGNIPPIHRLRAAGCPIAYGSDNNINDLFEVMRTALLTERIARDDPFPGTLPQPEDALEDATAGGARATRSQAGTIAVGRKADLIVIDTRKPHLVPAGRILSAWIHNGQPSDIETVMVDGRFVMRDYKVLTMDEAALVAEAGRVGKRVWDRVKASGPIPIPGRS